MGGCNQTTAASDQGTTEMDFEFTGPPRVIQTDEDPEDTEVSNDDPVREPLGNITHLLTIPPNSKLFALPQIVRPGWHSNDVSESKTPAEHSPDSQSGQTAETAVPIASETAIASENVIASESAIASNNSEQAFASPSDNIAVYQVVTVDNDNDDDQELPSETASEVDVDVDDDEGDDDHQESPSEAATVNDSAFAARLTAPDVAAIETGHLNDWDALSDMTSYIYELHSPENKENVEFPTRPFLHPGHRFPRAFTDRNPGYFPSLNRPNARNSPLNPAFEVTTPSPLTVRQLSAAAAAAYVRQCEQEHEAELLWNERSRVLTKVRGVRGQRMLQNSSPFDTSESMNAYGLGPGVSGGRGGGDKSKKKESNKLRMGGVSYGMELGEVDEEANKFDIWVDERDRE